MKNFTLTKNLFKLFAVSVLSLGFTSVYAAEATQMFNHEIDKSSIGGMNLAGATVFSMVDEEQEDPVEYYSFKLADIVTYPSSVRLSAGQVYTEANNDTFGNGGTAQSPKFAITNNAKNLDSNLKATSKGVNRYFFHTATAGAESFKMSGLSCTPAAQARVLFTLKDNTNNSESGVVVKYDIKVGDASAMHTIATVLLDDNQRTVSVDKTFVIPAHCSTSFDLSLSLSNSSSVSDAIMSLCDVYVYVEPAQGKLSISATNAVANYGTESEMCTLFDLVGTTYTLKWYDSADGTNFTELSSYRDVRCASINPPMGDHFYKAVAKTPDSEYESNIVKTSREMGCATSSKVLWYEDFGTLTSKNQRNNNQYVTSRYSYKPSGNVGDGGYAIVSNPRTAGSDNCSQETCYWFRDILDHTKGVDGAPYGGMLLVNCGSGTSGNDVVMERKIDLGCKNAFVNFSAWFANAGWDRGMGDNHPINMVIRVLSPSGTKLAEINVEGQKSEGWKHGVVSFFNSTYDQLTLQIVNYGESGGGNDVLVDDIQFYICRPDVNLQAKIGADYYDNVQDIRAECGTYVALIADGNNSFGELYGVDCPYYKWMVSTDKVNWTAAGFEGSTCRRSTANFNEYRVQVTPDQKYYKCVIGADQSSVDAYVSNPTEYACSSVVEAEYAGVRCPATDLFVSKTDFCNEYNLYFNGNRTNALDWYYGSDECGWTKIEGKTDYPEITLNVYQDMLKGGNCKMYIKAVDVNDPSNSAVSTEAVNYTELTLSAVLNEKETSGCDIIHDLVATYKVDGAPVRAESYVFTSEFEQNPIQESSSNVCMTKLPSRSGFYSVMVGSCSSSVYVDASCPQINYTNNCNSYTFTMVGYEGGDISWTYRNVNDWLPIPGAGNTTTITVDDISDLTQEPTPGAVGGVEIRVSEGPKSATVLVEAVNLSAALETIEEVECEKSYEVVAEYSYFGQIPPIFEFYDKSTMELLQEGYENVYETGLLSKTTTYLVKVNGCEAEVVAESGCMTIDYKNECNIYTFTVTGAQSPEIEWFKMSGQQESKIAGASGATVTLDVASLFADLNPEEIKMIGAKSGSMVAYVDVDVFSLGLEADPSKIEICGESSKLTATLLPGPDATKIPEPVVYVFYKKGDEMPLSEGFDATYTTDDLYSSTTFVVKAKGCIAETTVDVELLWPTIFTPYTEGSTNLTFDVCAENLKIFDRTGNMVADIKGNSWDGLCNGKMAMPGVYYYVATLADGSVKKGNVEIYSPNK